MYISELNLQLSNALIDHVSLSTISTAHSRSNNTRVRSTHSEESIEKEVKLLFNPNNNNNKLKPLFKLPSYNNENNKHELTSLDVYSDRNVALDHLCISHYALDKMLKEVYG